MDNYVLTQEGYDALRAELEQLKASMHNEIAQQIKEARAQGDLSENAEYDAAKAKQGAVATRINELTALLNQAQIISSDDDVRGKVSLGNKVIVFDPDLEEEAEYRVVGSTEVDALNGIISCDSPIGAALLGAKKGQTVTVHAPECDYELKVVKIIKA